MSSDQSIRFGAFLLDPRNAVVHCEERPVALTPKAFALLHCLAERPGRLVSKTELLEVLWPEAVVSEGVLKAHIREVRHALADDAKAPQIIETVHRRGYRFIAPLTTTLPPSQKSTVESQQSSLASSPKPLA